MMIMPRFATWWRGHNHAGEDYSAVDYIVDNRGYEPLPSLIARLCRGEIVPRHNMQYDGDDDDLQNLDDVPEVDDFVDADQIAADIADRFEQGDDHRDGNDQSEQKSEGA